MIPGSRPVGALLFLGLLLVGTGEALAPRGASRQRASHSSPERVREELTRILSGPEYDLDGESEGILAPWIERQIDGLFTWLAHLSTKSPLFFWILVIWLVAALIAILAHLTYVLVRILVKRGPPVRRERRSQEFGSSVRGGRPDPTDLLARARAALRAGRFPEAVRLLHLALVLCLDRLRRLTFDESKTNGEYVLEVARSTTGGEAERFRQVTDLCERVVYGRGNCSRAEVERMWSLSGDLGLESRDGEDQR